MKIPFKFAPRKMEETVHRNKIKRDNFGSSTTSFPIEGTKKKFSLHFVQMERMAGERNLWSFSIQFHIIFL